MTVVSLEAIVLAGGHSTRMGQDKALILIEGIPLLQRVCQVALECVSTVYVVTPWIERYQTVIPPGCKLIQEQTSDTVRSQGPLIGFAQALASVQADWVLLLACDMPFLKSVVIKSWLVELGNSEDAIAVLHRTQKGWEPLCGFYQRNCLTSLNAAIERGERSFQRWLADEAVKQLPVSDTTMFFNCNTPADLTIMSS